jgi:hypothetical protein
MSDNLRLTAAKVAISKVADSEDISRLAKSGATQNTSGRIRSPAKPSSQSYSSMLGISSGPRP